MAKLQFLDQFEDLRLRGHVQGCGGFIGDQEGGIEDECHGNHDPLALSTGQLVRVGRVHVRRVRQLHLLQRAQHLALTFLTRQAGVLAQDLVDLPAAGDDRVKGRHWLLEDH